MRIRFLIAGLFVAAGLWIGITGVRAQDVGLPVPPAPAEKGEEAPPPAPPAPGAESPRDLFNGFFKAMNDAIRFDRGERWDDAVALLDLSAVPESDRRTRGRELALQLKEVLDFHGKVAISELPDAGGAEGMTAWSLPTTFGAVEATRVNGRWLFSAGTLARIGAMRTAFLASGADRYEIFSLRDHVPEYLRHRTMGLEHWQWLGFVALALFSWIAHRIVVFFAHLVVVAVLRRRGFQEEVTKAADVASRPVGFFAVAAVFLVLTPLLRLPSTPGFNLEAFVLIGAKFFASLGAVLICYGLADVFAARLAEAASKTDSKLDDQLVPLLRKSLKIMVTVGGILFILDNLNVNVLSLVTGLGVAGIGVAFAAKDTIANLFGSITVFLDRPFQVGDWILVAGVEGTVEEVGFRSTRVRTFYNSLVSVPNAKLVDSTVDNMGRRQYRRFRTVLGIRYDTPPKVVEAFCEGIREIVRANEFMRQDYFFIHLNDWGASSLNILVYVFFRVPDWGVELRERQNFMVEVMRLAERLGVGFAFPTQTVHLESSPERPLPPAEDRPVDELDAVVRRFGRGGEESRPSGTEAFSPSAVRPGKGS